MSLFTINNVVVSIFVIYLAYTAYSLSSLLTIPACEPGEVCLKPYLATSHPRLQLLVYTSLLSKPVHGGDLTLVHHEPHFDYSSPTGEAGLLVELSLPRSVRRNNRTLHLHMFLVGGDVSIKSFEDMERLSAESAYATCQLAVHHTPPPQPYSLVAEQNGTGAQQSAPADRPVVHLRQQVTFSVMTELRPLPPHRLPPEIRARLRLVSPNHYLPFLHLEELSQRLQHLQSVALLPATTNTSLHYRPTGLPRLRLWLQFEAALHSLGGLGFTEKDVDEVKGIFETNLTLLCVTFCVALLHLLFDVLAFKHDISFWRERTSMAGLSGGAVVWRAFAQVVITLHLLEEDTSVLVLGPAAVGVVIELWKLQKSLRLRRTATAAPTCPADALEQKTQELDSQAFRGLCGVLVPLCGAGAVYSLLYMPHKSWYAWLLTSTVHGVYALGFVFMLPQLFINYRLRSVAHLPWRAFMYKAFNTFIDDLFAFIITMPTSHRVACFRDDVVFLIYLYQRWLYPVDSSRVNEFGSSGEGTTPPTASKDKRE